MRSVFLRLTLIAVSMALVASCDARLSTMPDVSGVGTSGGPGSGHKNVVAPTIVFNSPLVGALINVGDSVFVAVSLHDTKALRRAVISGVTEKGSVDLGTFRQTTRYTPITVPGNGIFRPGLRDTVIRRYLQPANKADTSLDSLIIVVVATDSAGIADTVSRRIDIVSRPNVTVTSPLNGDVAAFGRDP